MSVSTRTQFSSKIGFLMAAAGSAVGLGNIWGFPSHAANHGGAVFLLIYLFMVFVLAYPLLMVEFTLGRHGRSNILRCARIIGYKQPTIASIPAILAMVGCALILSFYAIVAGWLIGYFLAPGLDLIHYPQAAKWLTTFSIPHNIVLTVIFMGCTMFIVENGIANGIEKFSTRLMPILLILFIIMICYIWQQEGAMEGLNKYLVPNFNLFSKDVALSAMGQAFFSLSLGVGAMLVYGSYLSEDANIPKTALQVSLLDTGVAICAGLLIIPAMFVAQKNGITIYDESGKLLHSDTLIFDILPDMFIHMGGIGRFGAILFFALMIIAALTSSIAMLEVPVSCAIEELQHSRSFAVAWIGVLITLMSITIIFNFNTLFAFVINISTNYLEPLLSIIWACLLGWIWNRNHLLKELQNGHPDVASTLLWKIWPTYVKFICPLLLVLIFVL